MVNVVGAVARFDFRNPHAYVTVVDDQGKEWLLEANAAANLRRNGWAKDTFLPGDVVSFVAHANVDPDKTHVALESITTEKGVEYLVRIGANERVKEAAVHQADSLEGVWRGDGRLAFQFLFASIDHPLTQKAIAARARYDDSMDPAADCVVWPSPRLVAWSAFYPVEISFNGNRIYFTSEYGNTRRTVFMDGRDHPADGMRTNQGHSIGHWDGDTLVVDTRLFADHSSPIADGIPGGARKHVIERYALSDDRTTATVEIFLDDPEYLAKPFTAELVWNYAPQLEFAPFECAPEVARRYVQ